MLSIFVFRYTTVHTVEELLELMVSLDELPLVLLGVGKTEVAFVEGDDECSIQ